MTRVLISMPDLFLAEIDKMAKDECRSRSEILREAFRQYAKKNKKMFDNNAEKNASIIESLME